jgi:8-oxo-dGTP pyrophosphatase MutT (NUDIX family)
VKARKWRTLGNERVFSTPIFDLHRRRSIHSKRGERDFFVIDPTDWVNIIPLTPKREVIMVRQFRHGISAFTLEIPGGMIDPGDENPAVAGRREMIEECGYDSADIVALGRVHPNPAIQPNFCYSFLARNVKHVGAPHPNLDGSEETEVVVVPLKDIKGLIADGKITHALVITAFAFFDVYNKPSLAGADTARVTKPARTKPARSIK